MNRLLCALLVLLCVAAFSESFMLTLEGRPASAIVVGRWTDHVEHTAAMRLRGYVLRMTGAELPVLTRTYPDCAFLANWQPGSRLPEIAPYGALKPIFVSYDGSLGGEEFRLEVAGTHIRISGGGGRRSALRRG